MILWNKQAQETLAHYFTHIQDNGIVQFPFLLVNGPAHIWKTSVIEIYVDTLLGDYKQTDYLPVYDMWDVLWKKHTLKIEVAPKDQLVKYDNWTYVDVWARDVVKRLSLAPVGTHKIVFLENIDRMTIGAANALLKTWEEPLPNRIIIATTSNKAALLDTILSRAFVVEFQLPASGEVATYISTWYPEKTEEERMFALSFSMWRVWLAKKLLDTQEYLVHASWFAELVHAVWKKNLSLTRVYTLLQTLSKAMSAEQVIDAVLYACTHKKIAHMWVWMKARNMLSSNVNQDTILFHIANSVC